MAPFVAPDIEPPSIDDRCAADAAAIEAAIDGWLGDDELMGNICVAACAWKDPGAESSVVGSRKLGGPNGWAFAAPP